MFVAMPVWILCIKLVLYCFEIGLDNQNVKYYYVPKEISWTTGFIRDYQNIQNIIEISLAKTCLNIKYMAYTCLNLLNY